MDLCIYHSKKRFRLENKGFLAVYISRFFVDKRWKVVVDKWKVFHKGKILYISLFIYACINEYKKEEKVIHNKCGQPVPCGKRIC